MIKSTTKLGRPAAEYRTTWGEKIIGFSHLADGRWKVSGPPTIKFSERDERLAVARFRTLTASMPVPVPVMMEHATTPAGNAIFAAQVLPENYWPWLREQILTNAKYVAQMTGIQQIGWLGELKQPTASPTMQSLVDCYATKPGLCHSESVKVRRQWKEFASIVGISTLRELTHQQVDAYEKRLATMKLAPKSIKHRYGSIRTTISYCLKRGMGIEDCRSALDKLAMLQVKDHAPLDPKPICPADFWAIYDVAVKAGDKTFAALMLTALNCAMYGSEVSALKWAEIKGNELVTTRRKTGVSRVAILWPETVKLLSRLPRQGESVFNTKVRSHTVRSVEYQWEKFRAAAGLPHVQFSSLRDAAFSIGCKTSLDQSRVLMGHRLPGVSDHYLRRDPAFVKDVCAAIRDEFAVAAHAKK